MNRAKTAAPPLDIVEAMNHPKMFGPSFPGSSWDGWRAVLKGTYALPMSDADDAFFRSVAEREPPKRPVREAWYIVGRKELVAIAMSHVVIELEAVGRLAGNHCLQRRNVGEVGAHEAEHDLGLLAVDGKA